MLIIAGTTIGAGMLALPIASASLGFSTSLILLFAAWALMTYTALLMLELHQHAEHTATLNTLAKKLLGNKGQFIANISMVFLFYALCAAYIAGGGGQLQQKLESAFSFSVPSQAGSVLLAVVVATIISLGTKTVDRLNQVLFTVKIIALASIFYMLTPHVDGQYLLELPLQQGLVITALPVIFTSFGFHGSIPSIVKYVGVDIKQLRRVMIFGASLPLVLYIFWQLLSLGIAHQDTLVQQKGLNSFVSFMSSVANSQQLASAVTWFADLALATSFLGVSLGLFDFFADALKHNDSYQQRVKTAMITFIPPLGFALFFPQGFIMALGYAAIALAVLAVFLPVAMVWQQRKREVAGYQVAGGRSALILAATCGVIIVSAQFAQIAGVLPALS